MSIPWDVKLAKCPSKCFQKHLTSSSEILCFLILEKIKGIFNTYKQYQDFPQATPLGDNKVDLSGLCSYYATITINSYNNKMYVDSVYNTNVYDSYTNMCINCFVYSKFPIMIGE